MSGRGISVTGFLAIRIKIIAPFTMIFKITDKKNPITMISELIPQSEFNGCLNDKMPIAIRKQTLQMKAARLSILNKAIVQKSKFLHKIALFCLINQFNSYDF